MTTGPQHYANAEADIDNAAQANDRGSHEDVTYWLGCAQVHATLALAAATALVNQEFGMEQADENEWADVASAVVTAGIADTPDEDPF
jgi:hypothetical protein